MINVLFKGKRKDGGGWVIGSLIHEPIQSSSEYSIYCRSDHKGKDELGQPLVGIGKYRVAPETIGRLSCLRDRNGVEFFAGDLMMHNGKIYVVVDDGWRFRLERNLVHFGENHDVVLNEDTAYESLFWGNFHDGPLKNPGNGQKI